MSHQYTTRGTYSVSLSVSGYSLSRSNYILVGCKVPAFAGVRKNSATTTWRNAGFTGTISFQSGSGNYKIGYQSTAGGIVNPSVAALARRSRSVPSHEPETSPAGRTPTMDAARDSLSSRSSCPY